MRFEWPELRRCCICFPLRTGILTVAYINILICVTMVTEVIRSYTKDQLIHFDLLIGVIIVLYIFNFIFNIVLVAGIHMKKILLLRIYYYFMISTFLFYFIIEIIILSHLPYVMVLMVDSIVFYVTSLFVNMYLLCLVRSLIKKLKRPECHAYGNQLQQFDNGELEENTQDNSDTVFSEKETV